MSEVAINIQAVEIPGELKLSNPVPPPIAVSLPLVTWPSGPKNVLLGLLMFPVGVLFVFTFVALSLGAWGAGLKGIGDDFILVVILPISLFVGVTFTGAGLTCFTDTLRDTPVLEISAEGLRDRRSGLSVIWSNVLRAEAFPGKFLSVDLTLRGTVARWQNPFRIGVLFWRFRPKSDHVIVSTAALDVRAHVLIYTILALVHRHGGDAVNVSSQSFNMGLPLIPERTR